MTSGYVIFVLNSSPQAKKLLEDLSSYRSIIESKLSRRITIEVCNKKRLAELSEQMQFTLRPAAMRTPQGRLISFGNIIDHLTTECATVKPTAFGAYTQQQAAEQHRRSSAPQGTSGGASHPPSSNPISTSSYDSANMMPGFSLAGGSSSDSKPSSDAPNENKSYVNNYSAPVSAPAPSTSSYRGAYSGPQTGDRISRPSNSQDATTVYMPPPINPLDGTGVDSYFSMFGSKTVGA